jgi:sugar/nucleoside kinase (ribokinase family)
MLKITVIGSITRDSIFLPNGRQTKSFGGIFYNLLSLSYLGPKNLKIYPVCNLGEDIYKEAILALGKRKNIITSGIKKNKGKNNYVCLFCQKSGKRKEFLLSLVPALNFQRIKPYLNSDFILINFISGFDLSLKTLEKIRKSTAKPIYIDIHSLTLGIKKGGERFFRKPKFWRRYIRCADFLQTSWEELGVLSDGKIKDIRQARIWGREILKLGPKVLVVTLGKRGAFMLYREDGKIKFHLVAGKIRKTVDAVGCGDVFTSGFVIFYLQTKDFKFSLHLANRVASFKSTFSGTNSIGKLSRFTRLCQKAPPFMAGMNGEASLAEVPQSGTKAGLKEGFGEVSPFIFGKPRDLSRGGFTL